MANISNWKAYYERNYEVSVGTMKKEVKEVSQLCSIDVNTFPNSYYQIYDVNKIGVMSSFLSAGTNTVLYAYNPGLVYLSDNYYTLEDMFTIKEVYDFCNLVKTNYEDDIKNGVIRAIFSQKIFWQGPSGNDENDGLFLIPVIMSAAQWKTNPNTNYSNVYIALSLLATSFNPHYIGWNGYSFTYNNQPITFGTDIRGMYSFQYNTFAHHELVQGGIIYTFSPSNSAISDAEDAIDRFYNVVTKIKLYPTVDYNYNRKTNDGIEYIWQNKTTVPVEGKKSLMSFIIDLRECPYTPTLGFINQNYTAIYASDWFNKYGFIVEVKNTQTDAKDPNKKPDPNDEDPGTGPGGDKGDEGGDGDHDNDTDPIPEPGVPTISGSGVGLFTIFNPTSSQLANLGRQLWDPTAWQALKQYFTDPIETIIGLGIIPVAPRTGSSKNIHLGFYDTKVTAPVVDSDYVIKDCGAIPITRYYGSYLDYDPYTRIGLYLPYIGEIDIDSDQVMQKNLGVSYHVNVVTGDCTAIVTANGVVIYMASGNCMRQIPIAQKDFSSIINTAVSAVTTIASAGVSGAAAKSVGGAVAGASKSTAGENVANARMDAQLKNMEMGAGSSLIDQVMSSKMRFKHAGEMGGGAGQLANQAPYLIIERPNLSLASNYKGYVGYPCNKTLILSKCSGFTQIEATRLSIAGATDEEITEALSYLVEGVII